MTQKYIKTIDKTVDDGDTLEVELNGYTAAEKTGQAGTTRPSGIEAGGTWTRDNEDGTYTRMLYDGATDQTIGEPKVQVSSNDATPGDLETKLIVGTGLALDTTDEGANEKRRISLNVAAAKTALGIVAVLDEDDFVTDSETRPPSQQSTGAFVAKAVAAGGVPSVLALAKSATNSEVELTAGVYNPMTLDTLNVNSVSASVTTNQITLPAGTYYAEFFAPVSINKSDNIFALCCRLQNITDSLTEVVGQSLRGGDYQTLNLHGCGQFTLASAKALEVQVYTGETKAIKDMGDASGQDTVTTILKLWKIA